MLMFNADPSDIIAEAQSSHGIKFSAPPTPRNSTSLSRNVGQRRAVNPRMNAFDFSGLDERVCVKWILQNAVKSNHQKNKDLAVDLLNKLNITNYDLSSENITAVYFAITWNLKKAPSRMLTLAQSSHGVKL